MSAIPDTSSILLLVGGPEDGRVISGPDAFFMTKTMVTQPDGSVIIQDNEIGATYSQLIHGFHQSTGSDAMDDAIGYYHRCGVNPLNMERNKYRLTKKIDGLFVFHFVPEDPSSDQQNA